MSLKELAQKLNITEARLTTVAKQLFKSHFNPSDLTDDQIEQLTSNLQDAAEMASLPPAKRDTEILAIKQLNSETGSQIEKTIKTVGLTNLRNSRAYIDELITGTLKDTYDISNKTAEFIETYATNRIAQAYITVAKNLKAVQEEFNPNRFDQIIADVKAGKKVEFEEIDLDLLQLELDMM